MKSMMKWIAGFILFIFMGSTLQVPAALALLQPAATASTAAPIPTVQPAVSSPLPIAAPMAPNPVPNANSLFPSPAISTPTPSVVPTVSSQVSIATSSILQGQSTAQNTSGVLNPGVNAGTNALAPLRDAVQNIPFTVARSLGVVETIDDLIKQVSDALDRLDKDDPLYGQLTVSLEVLKNAKNSGLLYIVNLPAGTISVFNNGWVFNSGNITLYYFNNTGLQFALQIGDNYLTISANGVLVVDQNGKVLFNLNQLNPLNILNGVSESLGLGR